MPRTLPWLTGVGKTKRESKPPATEIKRTSSPRVKNETPTRKDTFMSRRDFLKSSPSPPSSPIHRCPSEEFLHEGLDKDDIFMMVEDEFYTVAQTFTQHLHYAEYIRRKKEAKLQNAATIADIARPTDGVTPMSAELKKKYAADELRSRQKGGLDAVMGKQEHDDDVGDDIEEENSWAGTHLQNLMLSPRRVRSLVGLQGIRSTTRAAAGFSQSSSLGTDGEVGDGPSNYDPVEGGRKEATPTGDTTDDDDDLDAGVGQSTPTISRTHGPSSSGLLRHSSSMMRPSPKSIDPNSEKDSNVGVRLLTRNHTQSSSGSQRRLSSLMRLPSEKRSPGDVKKELQVTESKDITPTTSQAKKRLVFDDFDELPELHTPSIRPEKQRPHCSNPKPNKLNAKDVGSKKSRLNEVPTFLI